MDGVLLDGMVSAIELNTENDIYTVMSYLQCVEETERKYLIKNIKRAVLKHGFTIQINDQDPNAIYFKDYPNIIQKQIIYNDIYDLKGYVEAFRVPLAPMDYIRMRKMYSKDIRSVYDIKLYRQMTQGNSDLNLLSLLNKVILDYSNKKVLNLYDKINMSKLKTSIVNCVLLDADSYFEVGKENKTVELLKGIKNILGYLPLDALGIIESLKIYLTDKNVLKSFIKDEFLVSNSSIMYIESIPIYNFGTCGTPSVYRLIENAKHYSELKLHTDTQYPLLLNEKKDKYILDSREVNGFKSVWIKPIMESIDNIDDLDMTRFKERIGKRLYDTQVNMTKLYALKTAKLIDRFYVFNNKGIILGVKKKRCYIVTENKSIDTVGLFPYFSKESIINSSMIMRRINFNNGKPEYDNPGSMLSVIESQNVELDKDSNLKFKIKVKGDNYYMNRYSEIHHALVQNHKNGNIEAMKNDLCRMYALVHIIEHDVIYSHKPHSTSVVSDANKARMFAKNDIARYLPEVIKQDKNFDIVTYFEHSNEKKELEKEYNIKINMLGVKHFFNSII